MKKLIQICIIIFIICFSLKGFAKDFCDNYTNENESLNKLQKDLLNTPNSVLEILINKDNQQCPLLVSMAKRILNEKKNRTHELQENLGKYFGLIIGNNEYLHWPH